LTLINHSNGGNMKRLARPIATALFGLLSACAGSGSTERIDPPDASAETSMDSHVASMGFRDAFVLPDPPDTGQAPYDANPMMMMQPGDPDAGPPLFSDGGQYRTPETKDQVFCGYMTTCDTAMQHCCANMTTGPVCAASSRPTDTCNIVLDCDGPEDCAQGQVCCLHVTSMGPRMRCDSSCDPMMMSIQVCHQASECPMTSPDCCTSPGLSFSGVCKPENGAVDGDKCDVP
jgi:hypothetical protein